VERADVKQAAKQSRQQTIGKDDIYSVLTQLSARMDRLQAELQLGIRDHAHFNELEEEATSIALGLRSAFRGKGTA
jgi:hypothetical protein